MGDRVAVFIDGSNLYHGLKNHFRRQDLNFTAFINRLCGNRTLFRAYYYNVLQDANKWPDTHKEQGEFLDILNKTPYLEARLGSTKVASGVPVEKGIDIMLASDLLYFGWHDLYDIAILVSGDADFAYALQMVKNMGKYVEVAYFETAVSRDVIDIADNRILLNQLFFKGLWASDRYPQIRRRKMFRRPPSIAPNNTPQPPPA